MSIEEEQNFPTYQDSDSVEYPQNENEVSSLIKKFYKSNLPIELIGSGSKRKIGKPLQCAKILSISEPNSSVFFSCSLSLPSNIINGCKLPSPA